MILPGGGERVVTECLVRRDLGGGVGSIRVGTVQIVTANNPNILVKAHQDQCTIPGNIVIPPPVFQSETSKKNKHLIFTAG